MRLMVHSRKVCANALGSNQPNRLQIQSYASKYCPFRADRRTAFLPMFAAQAIALLELRSIRLCRTTPTLPGGVSNADTVFTSLLRSDI